MLTFSSTARAKGLPSPGVGPTKNDQTYVEQKNWTAGRKLVGYGRYTSLEAREPLERIYQDWWLFANFSSRCGRFSLKKDPEVYDVAKTTFQ